MRRNALLGAGAALVALALVADQSRAQGYGVYEHDACVMGRSGTGVAAPCSGGSAVFFNPAGILASGTRTNIQVGGTLISPRGSYTDSITGLTTESVANNIPVPTLFITRQLSERLAVGFGAFAPYGLVSEWPDTFDGRFLAYLADLSAIYFQPTIAWRPTAGLRLGAGLTYAYSRAELKQRVDLSSQATTTPGVTFANLGVPRGTDFADARLEGHGLSASGHFGAIWDVNDKVSLGARYLMRQTADISGDATFRQVYTGITIASTLSASIPFGTPLDSVVAPQFRGSGALTDQKGFVDVPLPDQLVVGIAVRPRQGLMVLFDYQWVNWSEFETLEIGFAKLGKRTQFEDYEDSHGFRLGVEYQASPRLAVRGGTLYHTAAAPAQTVTPLLPEGERSEGTLGVSYQLTPRLRVDAAYQYIQQQDRRGRIVDAVRGPAGTAANSGLYTSTANLFGASLAFGF